MITLQVVDNVELALEEGAAGVFIINHDFDYPQMLPILRQVRGRFPLAFIGVNFHTVNGAEAFPILGRLAREGVKIDAYWADNACIQHTSAEQPTADMIADTRLRSAWDGLYFGGTAFKNPRQHQVHPCTRIPPSHGCTRIPPSLGHPCTRIPPSLGSRSLLPCTRIPPSLGSRSLLARSLSPPLKKSEV
jgi:hypothetical protein